MNAVRPTILLVDDDEDIRDAVRSVLEDEYDIVEAENGVVALSVLRGGLRPALVLLDLMMPVMSGEALLAVLNADAVLSNLPIVVFSAASDPSKARAIQRPVLAKPIDLDLLLESVERLCAT